MDDILIELRKISQQLADIKENTSKTNIAFNNFIGGFFSSLGSLVGFTLLTLGLIFLFVNFGWDKLLINYMQQIMSQMVSKTFSQLVPGRL